jgi:hypothetical protein
VPNSAKIVLPFTPLSEASSLEKKKDGVREQESRENPA